MQVNHPFVSPKIEQSDPTIAGPNEWNANHALVTTGELYLGRQIFTATGTYTPSASCKRVRLRGVSQGGGGGGSQNVGPDSAAGGGASGVWFDHTITPGGLITGGAVTIGTTGAGGSAGNNPGTVGGDLTVVINGTTYTFKGGAPGLAGGASSSSYANGGGLTAGSTAVDVLGFHPGMPGLIVSSAIVIPGYGGTSPYGGGGIPASGGIGTGGNGQGYGSGGAGGGSAGTANAGGNPGGGLLIIEEWA